MNALKPNTDASTSKIRGHVNTKLITVSMHRITFSGISNKYTNKLIFQLWKRK